MSGKKINRPFNAVLSQAANRCNTLAASLGEKERNKIIHEVTQLLELRLIVERIVYHYNCGESGRLAIAVHELAQGSPDMQSTGGQRDGG